MAYTISLTESAKRDRLEEADEFESEAAELGNSDAFMGFLEDRSREESVTPIELYALKLGAKDA